MSPVRLVKPRRFEDERGWFMETYSARDFAMQGLGDVYVQDNHSCSKPAGVLRGLHFQKPPYAQGKLVRCIRGAIFDVAVDIRSGSPTYGHWVAAELTARNGYQLAIPIGFAHGFLTLEPDTEVCYKATDFYAPSHDSGLAWDDPDIAIDWPGIAILGPLLSPKDKAWGRLADFRSPFAYDGRPLDKLEARSALKE